MIHVALDARPLTKRDGGISRFLWELVENLGRFPDLRLSLLSNRPLIARNLPPNAVAVLDRHWKNVPGSLWYALRFPKLVRETAADLAWGTQHVLPPSALNVPTVLTMHDMAYRRFPGSLLPYNLIVTKLLVKRSVELAHLIVCDSQFTQNELQALIPTVSMAKVSVIHLGRLELPSAEALSFELPCDFLFCLGSIEPRKNLIALLQTLSSMGNARPGLELILAGGALWRDGPFWKEISSLGLGNKVKFAGRLEDSQIRHCMERCTAFVLPSLYEGFGLPALEAAGIARRIILNDISVLREVGAYLPDPIFLDFSCPKDAAEGMKAALEKTPGCAPGSPAARLAMRTWSHVAEDYAALFEATVMAQQRPPVGGVLPPTAGAASSRRSPPTTSS